MNSMQCLAEIRQIERLQNVVVYMYSTSAGKAIVEQCKNDSATGFIKKHIEISDLKADLEKIYPV